MQVMKAFQRFIFFTALILIPLSSWSSAQLGEWIFFKGEKWKLLGKPIEEDAALAQALNRSLPDDICCSMVNSSGYTATWAIENGKLLLYRIDLETDAKADVRLEAKQMKQVFRSYYRKGKIHARWFNGTLRMAKGNVIEYIHDGYLRMFETECILTIQEGKVVCTQVYHNDKREGMRLVEAHEELSRLFPWSQFPNYKDKHIVFSVRDFKLTRDGKLLDVSVYNIYTKPDTLLTEDKQHSLILALKETLKSIYPWEVICYNGKYVMRPESETLSIVRKKE